MKGSIMHGTFKWINIINLWIQILSSLSKKQTCRDVSRTEQWYKNKTLYHLLLLQPHDYGHFHLLYHYSFPPSEIRSAFDPHSHNQIPASSDAKSPAAFYSAF